MLDLTSEHVSLRHAAREFAQVAIAPLADQTYRSEEFPRNVFDLLAEAGYLGLFIPEGLGGAGADLLSLALTVEEFARVCPTTASLLSLSSLGSYVLATAGTEELRARYVPRLARGEIVGCFCLTEPTAGSDNRSMKTAAERQGDEYVISGQKQFISNADVADIYTVFARTEPSGISAFLVERGTPGLSVGKPYRRMGCNALHACPVFLDGVRVPVERRVGPEGEGLHAALECLGRARPAVAARAVGLAQGALDSALEYARERVQFGRPIADFQGIQFLLADMATQLEAARWLVYRACAAVAARSPDSRRLVAMCKLFATDVAMRVTEDAVQVFGGYGMMAEYPVERRMAEAKLSQIIDGTNQIQRVLVARELLQGR